MSENILLKRLESSNEKPSSAPSTSKYFHRDENCKENKSLEGRILSARHSTKVYRNKHQKMPSSSSLHSLVSILKQPSMQDESQHQRSVPNVSFVNNDNDAKSNLSTSNTNASIDNSTSQLQYTIEGDELTTKSIPDGSVSTHTSTIGFRASFFSFFEKLGVKHHSQDFYRTSIPTQSHDASRISNGGRNSVTSLFFRTIYGGNY